MEHLNYWHWIEIVLIASILIAQLVVFIRICKKTKAYEKLFADKIGIKDDDDQVPKVAVFGKNGKVLKNAPIQEAVDNINTYIENNWGGSVNFSIVENIIERESTARDEEIHHLIPTPLYMGLAATMIGIILGLFSMGKIGNEGEKTVKSQGETVIAVDSSEVLTNAADYNEIMENQSNDVFIASDGKTRDSLSSLNEIDSLIDGVKIAMIASLFGLFWTTLLSTWIYKKTKTYVNFCKNSILNFLQSELLLPTEDNTLTGIRDCIDNFSRTVGHSITELSALAEKNDGIARVIQDSTVKQELILREIQEFKPVKVTKVLSDLFARVDANMEAYREFSQYLGMMGEITANMAAFSERTHNIEEIANELKSNLNESRSLFHFLSEHMRGVENIGQQSLEAINAADSHFNQAVATLDREVTERIRALSDGSNAFDTRITQIFEQVGNELQEITRRHVEALSNAYHDNLPEFRRLEKLDGLDAISEKLDGVGRIQRIEEERTEQIQRVITPLASIEKKNETQGSEILSAIKELNNRLDKIEKNTSESRTHSHAAGNGGGNNGEKTRSPQRPRFLKIILPVLAVLVLGVLAYLFVPKFIENDKADASEQLSLEFSQEIEKIINETPILCEKYRLGSLEESVDVPLAWKEDSLRYRLQLDRFWADDELGPKAAMVIENQKQVIQKSRQQDYNNLLINDHNLEIGDDNQ